MAKMDITMKKVLTPEFRVSFPKVFKPEGFRGGAPKYSITMLFPKKTDLAALKKAAHNAAVEKWGADKNKWPKTMRVPFRDGDEKTELKGYAGHITVSASASEANPPGIINQRKEDIIDPSEFYAGCYARATLIAFAYDNIGVGVSFSLQNLQKLRDGEKFSGKPNAADEFDAVEDASDNAGNYTEDAAGDGLGF